MPTKKKRLMISLDEHDLLLIEVYKKYFRTKQLSKVIAHLLNNSLHKVSE